MFANNIALVTPVTLQPDHCPDVHSCGQLIGPRSPLRHKRLRLALIRTHQMVPVAVR